MMDTIRSLLLDANEPVKQLCAALVVEHGDVQAMGPDGYAFRFGRPSKPQGSVIVTRHEEDGVEWVHASIARIHQMPSYKDLRALKEVVFGAGWAYQVFAPPGEHVNIHPNALHLFGRADGKQTMPNFGRFGSI